MASFEKSGTNTGASDIDSDDFLHAAIIAWRLIYLTVQ